MLLQFACFMSANGFWQTEWLFFCLSVYFLFVSAGRARKICELLNELVPETISMFIMSGECFYDSGNVSLVA